MNNQTLALRNIAKLRVILPEFCSAITKYSEDLGSWVMMENMLINRLIIAVQSAYRTIKRKDYRT